jgi:hypothetical protein
MVLVKIGKRGFSVLALMMSVCLTLSCVSTVPPPGEDWRTLRRVDLPAQLLSATWSDGSYMSEGHPMQFGRTDIMMDASGAASGRTIVKTPQNTNYGILIDNLTCYNAVRGVRQCGLLLNQPNRCHLFVFAEAGSSDKEDFDLVCPAYLTLGR